MPGQEKICKRFVAKALVKQKVEGVTWGRDIFRQGGRSEPFDREREGKRGNSLRWLSLTLPMGSSGAKDPLLKICASHRIEFALEAPLCSFIRLDQPMDSVALVQTWQWEPQGQQLISQVCFLQQEIWPVSFNYHHSPSQVSHRSIGWGVGLLWFWWAFLWGEREDRG